MRRPTRNALAAFGLAAAASAACVLAREGIPSPGGGGAGATSTSSSSAGGSGAGGSLFTSSQSGGGGVSSSSASTGGGGTATTSSGTGGGDASCSSGEQVTYEILRVGNQAITIDGACSEPAWAAANVIPFTGYDFSDNVPACKLLWRETSPAVVFGCCTVKDDELEAMIKTNDTDGTWADDGLEYFLGAGKGPGWPQPMTKVTLNIAGAVLDASWDTNGMYDVAYDAKVAKKVVLDGTLNDATPDMGYTIEWRAELGFDPALEQVGLCDFMIDDRDNGVRTEFQAFSTNTMTFNDPASMGTCKFSCQAALP